MVTVTLGNSILLKYGYSNKQDVLIPNRALKIVYDAVI